MTKKRFFFVLCHILDCQSSLTDVALNMLKQVWQIFRQNNACRTIFFSEQTTKSEKGGLVATKLSKYPWGFKIILSLGGGWGWAGESAAAVSVLFSSDVPTYDLYAEDSKWNEKEKLENLIQDRL